MRVEIDNQYKENIHEFHTKRTKKYNLLFELEDIIEFGFELEDKEMCIWYCTETETKHLEYPYKALTRCEVYSNGYLLKFKDGKCLFLPVTDNEEQNMELIHIGDMLETKYGGFQFVVIERLSVFIGEGPDKKSARLM